MFGRLSYCAHIFTHQPLLGKAGGGTRASPSQQSSARPWSLLQPPRHRWTARHQTRGCWHIRLRPPREGGRYPLPKRWPFFLQPSLPSRTKKCFLAFFVHRKKKAAKDEKGDATAAAGAGALNYNGYLVYSRIRWPCCCPLCRKGSGRGHFPRD